MTSGTELFRRAARSLRTLRGGSSPRDDRSQAIQCWPPGHFHSPVPSLEDIARFDGEERQASEATTVPGVDLNPERQLEAVRQLAQFYAPEGLPEKPRSDHRYYCENAYFSYADAVMLQTVLRMARPRRIVEVGSGYSSALILDVRDAFLTPTTHCTFIEPNPQRLELLLSAADRESVEIIESPVQEVSPSVFEALDTNDILFIDSSHVSKLASDVNLMVLSILPTLKPGVFVHVHDIFYPFEYPAAWIHEGRSWNEAYLIRAFLEFNHAFEIVVFNSYLRRFHHRHVADLMPLWERGDGGSLWLRRHPAPDH